MSGRTLRKNAPSLQGRLSMLLAGVLCLGALLAGWLIGQGYRNERSAMERHLGDTVRALATVMETELGKREAMLKGLSLSTHLARGDLAAFEIQARQAVKGSEWIVLLEPGRGQRLNTALPPGATYPPEDKLPELDAAIAEGKTYISNLIVGNATGRHVLFVAVPVTVGGKPMALCLAMTPSGFTDALLSHRIGAGWLIALVDRHMTVAGRSRSPESFIGKQASDRMTGLVRARSEGIVDTTTLDGVPSITAFYRSPRSGWTMIVAAPRSELFEGAQSLAMQALGMAIAAGLLAVLVSVWAGRSIIAGIDALVEATETLGRGERFEANAIGIHEIDVVSGALANASEALALRESSLARARDEAVAATRAKDEFLASLSHELRTPLNPVLLLASDGANDPAHPPALREIFQSIARNVSIEARLIDDLLDLTRISSGKLSLHLQPVGVDVLVRETIETLQRTIDEKPLELTLDLRSNGASTTGDPMRLRQVFWNLLNNAIKFTPARGKLAVISRVDAAAERIIIAVTDSGLGMNTAELNRLFQRFAQGDHAANGGQSTYGGLGLGLVIARTLVEMHHGEIVADSAGRGLGSTFTVSLPLLYQVPVRGPDPKARSESSDTNPPFPLPTPAPKTWRILLVEDHKPTLVTLEKLLARRGHQVHPSGTAAGALELAAQHPFDLVISDIGLPDRSGYELMQELTQRHGLKGIAMSGYGSDSDRARGRDAGFLLHLTKPVSIASLEDALSKVSAN